MYIYAYTRRKMWNTSSSDFWALDRIATTTGIANSRYDGANWTHCPYCGKVTRGGGVFSESRTHYFDMVAASTYHAPQVVILD